MTLSLCQIVGYKNSGKTTLTEALIRFLRVEGRQVGVLKHHGHKENDPMISGDSGRHFDSGGSPSSVVSPCFSHSSYREEPPLEAFVAFYDQIPGLDWLLIEGYKEANLPKILVASTKSDWQELCVLSNIKAIVTQDPTVIESIKGMQLPHFRPNDVDLLGRFLLNHEGWWTEGHEL